MKPRLPTSAIPDILGKTNKMKEFSYRGLTKEGEKVTGLIESSTTETAVRVLQERKLLVLEIKEKRNFSFSKINFGKKVSEREIATFTRLLATMLGTGLPLTDAISNLINQNKSGYFREVLQSILHEIQSGVSLSVSMSHYPEVFNELYINLLKAGEVSGKVDDTLSKLADTLEANLEFKSKVTAALIYPFMIVIVMIGIGIFMITTIIPKVAEVYKEYSADLPLPTRLLISLSDIISNYTIWVIIFLGLVALTIRTLRKNPTSELYINNLMFKIPIMGLLNKEVSLALICRTMGTLLASGVAILDALKIVSKTMANNFFRTGLLTAADFVEKGLPLSMAFKRNLDFPMMVSQLLAIGEETGTIDQSFARLADFYQTSAERKLKVLTTLLEPLMILLMGGMVALMAIAILMPMFNLVNVIK